MGQMTNRALLVILKTCKHNLDLLNPQQLQRTQHRNAQVNLNRAIDEVEDRIRKGEEGLR